MRVRTLVLGFLPFLLVGGCANDPTTSEEYQALGERMAAVEQERDELAAELDAQAELPPILTEFKAAYESGDLDRIRDLYVEDGIFSTAGDVYELYYGSDSIQGTLGLHGSEFERRASIHSGELEVFDPVVVGDTTVGFGWRWSDFASGTGTMKLRDGKIVVLNLFVAEAPL